VSSYDDTSQRRLKLYQAYQLWGYRFDVI